MPNHLLPQNQTALEAAIATAAEFTVSPDVIATLWSAEQCPAELLPWLAWALSVDDWDSTWDEATQRRVIASSIDIHRKKGTIGAVKKALSNFENETKIVEWWQKEPQGTPHTFQADVEIGNRGINPETVAAIRCLYGQIIEICPYQITELVSPDVNAYSAISVTFTQTMTVYPPE